MLSTINSLLLRSSRFDLPRHISVRLSFLARRDAEVLQQGSVLAGHVERPPVAAIDMLMPCPGRHVESIARAPRHFPSFDERDSGTREDVDDGLVVVPVFFVSRPNRNSANGSRMSTQLNFLRWTNQNL